MNNEQWEVRINDFDYKLESQVFIYRFIGKTLQYLEINSPNMKVCSMEYNYGAINDIKPTFICNKEEAIGIAKAFIAYANSQGFKNGSETYVKGKLEATESHLKDMRTLLKIK